MKLGFRRGQKGFTLIEIIIVLAVIGVLAAVVIPNVTGFLSRGKERSWSADRDILQAAVDAWRTDPANTGNQWPTIGGVKGAPATGASSTFIDFDDLVNRDYLKSDSVVKSADTAFNTTAGNTVSGSYGWYINADGAVDSFYDADNSGTVNGTEATDNIGFQTDIYP